MLYTAVVAALGLPLLVTASLPSCSNIDRPCSCDAVSTFKNITTYATIGATAKDVGAVMNDFFNTSWYGTVLLSTTGTDDVVGATRTFSVSANGSVTLTEALFDYAVEVDGSFIQRYNQSTATAVVQKPGSTSAWDGYWETIAVQQTAVRDESSVVYSAYRCDIGDPFDTAGFHERSINDTIAILAQEGKDTGTNVYPYSTTSLVAT